MSTSTKKHESRGSGSVVEQLLAWLKFLINPSAPTKEDRRKEEKERGRKNTNVHNVKTATSRIQYKTESHPNKQKKESHIRELSINRILCINYWGDGFGLFLKQDLIVQTGLKLTMEPGMTLNFWSSFPHALSAEIRDLHYHNQVRAVEPTILCMSGKHSPSWAITQAWDDGA